MSEQTLFERLGGYRGIVTFVEDVMPRIREDKQLGRFYRNRGNDGVEREQQLLVDFLCARAGGQMYYTGRSMKLVHKGMNIVESDWTRLLDLLRSSMRNLLLPEQECTDLINFLESIKSEIVEE